VSTEQPSTLESLEKTLPRASYLDAGEFQREYAAIFESGWVCVGRSNALTEPGDYLAIRFQDQSLVVVRAETVN
jgi:Rieske 2Fe-2S family protein